MHGDGATSTYGYDSVNRLASPSHDMGGTDTYKPASHIVTKTAMGSAA